MSIKIYSWNILYKNKDIERVLAFLLDLDFDILALQEVPGSFIAELSELPYFVSHTTDWSRAVASDETADSINLVVLSRYPIRNEIVIPLPDYSRPRQWPLRTRFLHAMGWKHPFANKNALCVEILLPNTSLIQVFCIHLELFIPETRQREFDEIMKYKDPTMPSIICGDFNLLELPHITLLNWLSGGRFSDFIFWWRERNAFQKRFSSYSLVNPLRGKKTHPIAFSQIDHILVPRSMRVTAHRVLTDMFGSDHHPVMVEVEG